MKDLNICMQRRYLICLLGFFGFFINYLMRVNLSVAIITMTKDKHTLEGSKNFTWSKDQVTYLLGTFFYGYLLTQILGGYVSSKHGGKKVFLGSVFISSVLSLMTPVCALLNFYALLTTRFMLGVVQGAMYPCCYCILHKWAPPWERSRLLILIFTGSYAGTAVAMSLGSVICDTIGWSWIFYIPGFCGCVWCISWMFLISESPTTDKRIKPPELIILQEALKTFTEDLNMSIPWKRIFLSPPVWAINIAHMGNSFVFFFNIMHFPSFMYDLYDIKIRRVGIYASLPHVLMIIVSILSGYVSDIFINRNYLSPTTTRKLFTCSALLFQAMISICEIFWMTPLGSTFCATLNIGIGSIAWAGYSVNHFDICPQFSHITMGFSNTLATLAGIIITQLVRHIVHGTELIDTKTGWIIILYIASGFCLMGAIVYAICASGRRQYWAMNTFRRGNKTSKLSSTLLFSLPSARKSLNETFSNKKITDEKTSDGKTSDENNEKPFHEKTSDKKISEEKTFSEKISDEKILNEKASDNKVMRWKLSDEKRSGEEVPGEKKYDEEISNAKTSREKISDEEMSNKKTSDENTSN